MIIYLSSRKTANARVVELADSLDSGSSVHSGRAGSSPASRTKLSEHFGSTGEKPSDFKVFGFFMTENFQSIRWLNGNGAEVRTGFEPLLFHIQVES